MDLIVDKAHKGTLDGHFGISKTFEILKGHFYGQDECRCP